MIWKQLQRGSSSEQHPHPRLQSSFLTMHIDAASPSMETSNNNTRTVYATVKTVAGTQAPRAVRFEGLTFADLRARLMAANLPGVADDSFLEIRDEGGEFICLLDQDQLPAGDIFVNVHNYSSGLLWQKTGPVADGLPSPPAFGFGPEINFDPPHWRGNYHGHPHSRGHHHGMEGRRPHRGEDSADSGPQFFKRHGPSEGPHGGHSHGGPHPKHHFGHDMQGHRHGHDMKGEHHGPGHMHGVRGGQGHGPNHGPHEGKETPPPRTHSPGRPSEGRGSPGRHGSPGRRHGFGKRCRWAGAEGYESHSGGEGQGRHGRHGHGRPWGFCGGVHMMKRAHPGWLGPMGLHVRGPVMRMRGGCRGRPGSPPGRREGRMYYWEGLMPAFGEMSLECDVHEAPANAEQPGSAMRGESSGHAQDNADDELGMFGHDTHEEDWQDIA